MTNRSRWEDEDESGGREGGRLMRVKVETMRVVAH